MKKIRRWNYDTWTKKHEEEYLAAKKRYETAYANKVKYTREKTAAEITKLNGELATVKSNITRYASLISDADSTMRTASVDMAYHKKYMTA